MTKEQLLKIRKLVDRAIFSSTKSEAASIIKELEFLANTESSLNRYAQGKLREVVNYTKEAAGQVKNKDHWISCMESSWYVLEQKINNTSESK